LYNYYILIKFNKSTRKSAKEKEKYVLKTLVAVRQRCQGENVMKTSFP
jgi:hypothetical protein